MAITILKKSQIQNDDLVIIPRKEYEVLRSKAENVPSFPVIQLRGSAARKLDRRVASAVREYRSGKLKAVKTLRELI